ncbi:hypothetical protein JM946_15635 [Steroidobacter sp. S1-65]|uniref:FkbM family methyltransferase n=1 Tax=Steroidobacter gossypii TaxID=2805490 RepID=A0ABS1WYV9_9GAMM|nr:hypothetical protein [Steroidobacter gossypii]MBM0106166.1 hypothetical protein [Steroidobacter gossypii]
MKDFIRTSAYRIRNRLVSYSDWRRRGYAAPSPHHIKQACVIRNGFPNATWVETGTYLGDTTRLLSKHGSKVYSIEPEPTLFANAKRRFSNVANVEIINGTSESVFPSLLPTISGDVNFWLDGHYSGGITFQGTQTTPIVEELKVIAENRGRFGKLCVQVDDIRLFNPDLPEGAGYPPVDILVQWANEQKLGWHIEHDIFVARG